MPQHFVTINFDRRGLAQEGADGSGDRGDGGFCFLWMILKFLLMLRRGLDVNVVKIWMGL